jgi:hypothetical protein
MEIGYVHYIYLVKLREHIKSNENIYKIGKTTQINTKRFRGYPKGSIVLFQIICSDCHKTENDIKQLFKSKYIQRKEYGNEYFEGNHQDMIKDMFLISDCCLNIKFSNILEEFEEEDVSSEELENLFLGKRFNTNDDRLCESISSFVDYGHYIGNLDKLINENQIIKVIENQEILRLKISKSQSIKNLFDNQPNYPEFRSFLEPNETLYNVIKYTNAIPLILDTIKKIFYISRCDYIVGEIKDKKYLIYKNYNEVSLNDYLKRNGKDNVSRQVQSIFIFNWLMCVKNGLTPAYENNIYIKSINPFITDIIECSDCLQAFSINENNFLYDTEREISSGILTKWFDGNLEKFYKMSKSFLEGINIENFRYRFRDVVNFYDNDYIPWVNSVYDRMNFIKNYDV